MNFDSSFLILTLPLPIVAVLLLLDDIEADRIKELLLDDIEVDRVKEDDDDDDDKLLDFNTMISLLLKSNDLELDKEERSLQLACFF